MYILSDTLYYDLICCLVGLEHQHIHNAPHAQHVMHTEEVVAVNAPDLFVDRDHNPVSAATATAAEHVESMGDEYVQIFMGLSLLLGFIFMLFVDQVGGGHSHAPSSG